MRDYRGPIRQIVVTDLGHEAPTVVLTNQLTRSAVTLVGRYAQRMLIENGIADGVDFFHIDALSSAVAMKVSCDLQLTLMASSLYRLLGEQIGNGYAAAKSQHIFRDFIDAVAHVMISEREILVRFPETRPQPLAHGRRLRADSADRTVARQQAPAAGLRIAVVSTVRLTSPLRAANVSDTGARSHPG